MKTIQWDWVVRGLAVGASLLLGILRAGAQDHDTLHFWSNECASCHGQRGEGVDEVRGPALAGLPSDYVMKQIREFRDGLRGREGTRNEVYEMHREAAELDDQLFRRLAGLIEGLSPKVSARPLGGDLDRGERLYSRLCAGCHGANAEGVPAKGSPPLYGFQGWYLASQIEKLRDGRRKKNRGNPDAVTMHQVADILWGDTDVRDVVAYITTRLALSSMWPKP